MFVRLCIFQRQLQTNCTRFKKKKALDADPRAIQQIVFQGKDEQKTRLYTILEK